MEPDPYRVLGLERGASLDAVKKAYRRLAKENHPDAAGEAALPRFLAIQAAYDQIAGPDASARRVVGGRPADRPRRDWEADPDRAGATYRAYGGRPRPRPGPRPGPRPRAAPRPDRQERTDRPPKKATLGSTSYDDVDPETFAPDWGGASWYGTTSGTYWTLNPKEYADPRKHGPEYQARARRSGGGQPTEASGSTAEPAGGVDAEPMGPADAEPRRADASEGARGTPPPPTHTTSSWWEATAGEPPRTEAPPPPPAARRSGTPEPEPGGDTDLSTDAVLASLRRWLDDDHPTIGARIGRAVVGWAPMALGVGWAAGEISGCGRYTATCPPSIAPMTWGIQVALLVLLILLPRVARVATVATIATLATMFPASVLLFATGSPESMAAARTILGGLIVVAWSAGMVYGVVREAGRGARPVS